MSCDLDPLGPTLQIIDPITFLYVTIIPAVVALMGLVVFMRLKRVRDRRMSVKVFRYVSPSVWAETKGRYEVNPHPTLEVKTLDLNIKLKEGTGPQYIRKGKSHFPFFWIAKSQPIGLDLEKEDNIGFEPLMNPADLGAQDEGGAMDVLNSSGHVTGTTILIVLVVGAAMFMAGLVFSVFLPQPPVVVTFAPPSTTTIVP